MCVRKRLQMKKLNKKKGKYLKGMTLTIKIMDLLVKIICSITLRSDSNI